MSALRLAVVSSHPVQYHAPWFRAMAARPELDLEVFFCHRATPTDQSKAGFGVEFDWDGAILDGYASRFLTNVAQEPSVSDFNGIDTPEVADAIRGFDAVPVSGWHYKAGCQAIWASRRAGIPVMVRSDSHLHTSRSRMLSIAKWIPYRLLIPKIDGCLSVGQWSSDYFLHYGADPRRIFVVPHVIDDDIAAKADALRKIRPQLRSAWHFGDQHEVFAFVGKFVDVKRPTDFVRAIALAHGQDPRVVGLMVGDGPLRQECQRVADMQGAPITFAGFLNQSRVTEAYVVANALVLPSTSETWGLVVNEAMACGLPCLVTTRVGCRPDLVHEGRTGLVFPVGDVGELAAQMVRTVRYGDLSAMGVQARAQSEVWSPGRAAEGVVNAASFVVAA